MSHLLALSIGPVQEFIAAARRTRDLWLGSFLLSEVSRAAAEAVALHGELIFPASSEAGNVANVILAELKHGEPREVAARAGEAARARWRRFADDVRKDLGNDQVDEDIWRAQVDDVIEFFAAWVSRSADYPSDRRRVMRLLAGRKNCRDFLPARGRPGVPKSSLDGQRESVLRRRAARLRLTAGEELDIVGVVKRVAEGSRPYPSVARVAAAPWVRGNCGELGEVTSACRDLGHRVIRPLDPSVYPQYQAFPFEGTAVFPDRHHDFGQETGAERDAFRPLQQALARLRKPNPYLAVLVADGDRIGVALDGMNSPDRHRDFSRALAVFAGEAEKVVVAHGGVLVYAGGDDVLAFVPVDKCLGCARKLRDAFAEALKEYGPLTLSVGLAIGHFMENLEDLLEYGRAAERHAKQPDRDGLAVHLHKRGGSPVRVRLPWRDRPDERWARYARLLLEEAIPSKLPYDLRNLADLYDDWPSDTVAVALRQDVLRLLRAKQPRLGGESLSQIRAAIGTITDADGLRRFAEELLVARQIAAALRDAGEETR